MKEVVDRSNKPKDRTYRPLVYVCSPLSGDVPGNTKMARKFCRFALEKGAIPLAPHLMFPQFMNDDDPAERELAIFMDVDSLVYWANETAIAWYRVRKTWADSKSQIGAFKVLTNAKECADKNPEYNVFDVDGVNIYTGKTTAPAVPFLVKVSISDLNIRKGPGTDYSKIGQYTGKGVFTIVEVKSDKGSTEG